MGPEHDMSAFSAAPARTGKETAEAPQCLLDIDPELAAGLDRSSAGRGGLKVPVPVRKLGRGEWVPSNGLRKTLALLIVDGLVVRKDVTPGLESLTVYGPGDLVDVHRIPVDATWSVRRPARVAALDGHILAKAREHPQLLVALLRRLLAAGQEHLTLAAIARRTRVNERLLALMTHFAGRWGRVTPDGVVVDLPLTHSELGDLIGARRPTVTIAVAQLTDEGALRRLEAGQWLIPRTGVDAEDRFVREAPADAGTPA
jgi:CRP-like cAMP-binding protein